MNRYVNEWLLRSKSERNVIAQRESDTHTHTTNKQTNNTKKPQQLLTIDDKEATIHRKSHLF